MEDAAPGILGVEIAEGGGKDGGATTWIPATDGGTGLESVLKEEMERRLDFYFYCECTERGFLSVARF